ncbi:interleukin-12 subunit beta-like [Scyliorhinus canicula]|uniref:interleukin-12 subunit beta-like n=1 Tax=Scyliorhinus canicula TaxID=7830 RepID=UPI0018F44422|nr:interleukin-12 subunit beta-like [Scyliorhinus canicula]
MSRFNIDKRNTKSDGFTVGCEQVLEQADELPPCFDEAFLRPSDDMIGRLFLSLYFLSLTVTVRMAFEEKYSIVNKTNQLVELNCEASSDQQWAGIHWRLDGVPLSKNAHSNKLNVEVTDRPDAGNYSCHMNSTGAILKHYYILIDVERQTDKILKETNRKYITCQAERFGGTFTCFWTEREKAIFSASFHRDGWNGDTKDCVLTPCTSSECTVQATCTDQTFSPYAEELRQITITVEAATSKRYEKHTKHFYIRDICKYTCGNKIYLLKVKVD